MPNSEKKRRNSARPLFRRKYDFAGGCCVYCLEKVSYDLITRDHVIPLSRGGSHAITNIVPCCFSCNQKKADQLGWIPKVDFDPFEQQLLSERGYNNQELRRIGGTDETQNIQSARTETSQQHPEVFGNYNGLSGLE